jgi:diguanylate cyclase (GGDEF)-like protein
MQLDRRNPPAHSQAPLGWPVPAIGPGLHRHRIARQLDHTANVRLIRRAYLGVMGLLTLLFMLVPAARPATATLAGTLTAVAIGVGITLLKPRRWLGWVVLSGATVATMAEVGVFALIGHTGPPGKTFPSPNEIIYLVATCILMVALVVLGRPPMRSRNLGMLLDVAGISLTNSLVVWVALLRPATAAEGLTPYARTMTFVNFIVTMVVFVAAIRMILDWFRVGALRWVGVGVLLFFLAGGIYAAQLQHGRVDSGGASDLFFLLFAACCGAAALTPSMAVIWSDRRGRGSGGTIGVAALTLSVLVMSAALLVEAQVGPVSSGVSFAIAFAGLGVIAVIRLSLQIGHHRRRTAQARALRAASAKLVAANSEEGVVAGISTALHSMLPDAERLEVALTPGSEDRSLVSVGEHGSPDGRLTIPLPTDPGAPVPRALAYSAPITDLVELTPLLEAITDHAASALERISLATQLRVVEQTTRDLVFQASHDPLTGLANRNAFQRRLESTAAQAVLFVDLDDFKRINDTYGHHVGDRVLEVAARRIESCLRPGDLAARLGGDEFAVLLCTLPDERTARLVAQRITDILAGEVAIDGMVLNCRASIGLAHGRPAVSTAELRQADVALYAAKAAGKGCWSQYGEIA